MLVYGSRAIEDIIFKEALDRLASEHESERRFVVRHVLERPPAGWGGGMGLLDGVALERELGSLSEPEVSTHQYFLCGPEPMMRAARACLEARGVAPASVCEERFATAQVATTALPRVSQVVNVRSRGEERQLVVAPQLTVLEAAIEAGVDMPYSCTVGGCGTCRVRVLQGDLAMDEPNCLSDQERAEGYVLACIARPTSPCVVEVP